MSLTRLSRIPESRSADVADGGNGVERPGRCKSSIDHTYTLQKDRSTRRGLDIVLLSGEQNERDDAEDGGGDEVCYPETVIAGKERRRDGTTRSKVDTGVEPEIDTLDGNGRRLDDGFTGRKNFWWTPH